MYQMPHSIVMSWQGHAPKFAKGVFIASGAAVIGQVEMGEDVNVWFNTVVRGDVNTIKIGARTNIQDNTTVHVTSGTGPTWIGSDVTIGHNAVIHACTIEDLCLIGMGSTILDGAVIGRFCSSWQCCYAWQKNAVEDDDHGCAGKAGQGTHRAGASILGELSSRLR